MSGADRASEFWFADGQALIAGQVTMAEVLADPRYTGPDGEGTEPVRLLLRWLAYAVHCRYRRWSGRTGPQRRARALLRCFLTPAQRQEWRDRYTSFTVTGSAGGEYFLYPETGTFAEVSHQGKRRYALFRFYLHTPPQWGVVQVPPADESLAQLLWLRADEPAVRRAVHVTTAWDSHWWRGMVARWGDNRLERWRELMEMMVRTEADEAADRAWRPRPVMPRLALGCVSVEARAAYEAAGAIEVAEEVA